MPKEIDLEPYEEWARRVYGKNNFTIELRNGEVCIDAWNPEANCIGMIWKKEPKIKILEQKKSK